MMLAWHLFKDVGFIVIYFLLRFYFWGCFRILYPFLMDGFSHSTDLVSVEREHISSGEAWVDHFQSAFVESG